jgi:hypothetical protein
MFNIYLLLGAEPAIDAVSAILTFETFLFHSRNPAGNSCRGFLTYLLEQLDFLNIKTWQL